MVAKDEKSKISFASVSRNSPNAMALMLKESRYHILATLAVVIIALRLFVTKKGGGKERLFQPSKHMKLFARMDIPNFVMSRLEKVENR
jgi:hypothetical protein